jgi:hypothetical protein
MDFFLQVSFVFKQKKKLSVKKKNFLYIRKKNEESYDDKI